MLEVRNLVKIYKPKKGVPVTAINNVSIRFPEKGLVFLLGKSGSGKSTLLNLLGGLDRYDNGDILIRGASTRTFKQSHFDSYRNTYVGFIFQEYNILDEFSVGVNIGLALQLQGQKATSERINQILQQVDLAGYGDRKPNELSGGQKQRVAIARALVKNPRIIMADEPTGALDSVTGRQVLATLKKLSRDKLVIVVSHDQEFAEQYADRIITLADGYVIGDLERTGQNLTQEQERVIFGEDSVSVPMDYVLTDQDMAAINQLLRKALAQGKTTTIGVSLNKQSQGGFAPTDQSRIPAGQGGYQLIKSELPMKYAFKLGVSGMKVKKFRLFMTIFLSCIAFVLFGVADTIASYNYVDTCTKSLADPSNNINYINIKTDIGYEDTEDIPQALQTVIDMLGVDNSYWSETVFTPEDIEELEDATGLDFYPVMTSVFGPGGYIQIDADFTEYVLDTKSYEGDYYYYGTTSLKVTGFSGYIEIDEDVLEDFDAELIAGELPQEGTNQVVVSDLVLYTFKEYGYQQDGKTLTVLGAEDLLGKTLVLDGREYTICGVVDTGVNFERYEQLETMDPYEDYLTMAILSRELQSVTNYSLAGYAMLAPGQLQVILDGMLAKIETMGEAYTDTDGFYHQAGYFDDQGNLCMGAYEDRFGNVIWPSHYDEDGRYYADGYLDMYGGGYDCWGNYTAMPAGYYDQNGQYCPDGYTDSQGYFYDNSGSNWGNIADVTDPGLEFEAYYGSYYIGGYYDYATGVYTEYTVEDVYKELVYGQCIAGMPESVRDIRTVVEMTAEPYDLGGGQLARLELQNPVNSQLAALDMPFSILGTVFVVVGIVFVIFAALLFSNFIGVSISYKKREIGILRAIGSRGSDVFRIFFAESFVIAMINFVLSFLATVLICAWANSLIRNETGLLLTLLNVGIRQFVLLLAVCLFIAFIASFLPVKKIASKRPIDAIRDR